RRVRGARGQLLLHGRQSRQLPGQPLRPGERGRGFRPGREPGRQGPDHPPQLAQGRVPVQAVDLGAGRAAEPVLALPLLSMGAAQSRAAAVAALEARLGYVFADRALLEQALTHASTQSQGRSDVRHNERLEFLGDRVLGLTIARVLYETFPDGDTALLTKHLNSLVSREVCAEVARAIGIDKAF